MAQRRSGAKKKPARKPSEKGSRRLKLPTTWRGRAAFGAAAAFGLLVLFGLFTYAFAGIPDPEDVETAQAVTVLDTNGRRMGTISGGANRVSIPFAEMPEHLREAVVAIEDRTFYSHSGLAPLSILRATWRNIRERRAVEGGSTITQQYVKNAFVGTERSLFRKLKEAVIAIKLERKWTKDEILEAYLNTIYLGRGAYGIEAAARTFFGRKARDLTLEQSALLAGMIVAPEGLDPASAADEARARRNVVLTKMAEQDYITARAARLAKREPVKVKPRRVGGLAPHFLEEVRKLLEREVGPRALYAGGVTVTVTLDRGMQRAAERAVRSVYDKRNDPQAALVAIEPASGEVRAMVGGRDFARMQFNLATQARRQPGSTFKTAVLAAALEEGMSPGTRFDAPATITIDADPEPWTVSNYDLRSHGSLTVARATELSVNTVYAQMIERVGPDEVADAAGRLGIISELQEVLSLALGTSEVSVLELTSMYATLGARGQWREPLMVRSVTDASGEVLYEPEPSVARAVEQPIADHVNQVLQGVMTRGTGTGAQIGRPAAGKTGTTENFRDALFAGYTPDLAAVVWNGYPRGKTLQDVRGINVTGGSFPAAMWEAFMEEALADVPPTPFTTPEPLGDATASPTPSASATATLTTEPSAPPAATSSPSPTASPSPSPSPTPSPSPSPSPSRSRSPSPSPSPSPAAT